MKRRINFTNRKKINKSNVEININRNNNDEIESFDATVLIDKQDFEDESTVYLEAYHKTDFHRYKLGKVKNLRNLENQSLDEYFYPEHLHFRIKIVSNNGLITGLSNQLKPVDEGKPAFKRKGIIDAYYEEDLGAKVWEIDYISGRPTISFNKNIPNIKSLAESDPTFFVFVIPQVIKNILYKILLVDKIENFEEPDTDWHKDWINFASKFCTDDMQKISSLPNIEKEEIEEWIKSIIDNFTTKYKSRWDNFIKYWSKI